MTPRETHTQAAAAHHRAVADHCEVPFENRLAAQALRRKADRIERRKDRACSIAEFRLRNKLDEYGEDRMDEGASSLICALYRYHCGQESLEDLIATHAIEEDDVADAIDEEMARRPQDVELIQALNLLLVWVISRNGKRVLAGFSAKEKEGEA